MKLSLKNRFLIPTVTAVIICLGSMSLFSYRESSKALENSISEQVKYVSVSISNKLTNWVKERKKELKNYSEEMVFKTAAQKSDQDNKVRENAYQRLLDIKKNIDFIEFVALADQKGDILASSDPGHVGSMNVAARDYFKAAVSGSVSVSAIIKSKSSGLPVFCISSPVRQHNRVVGVLLGAVELDHFTAAFVDSEKVGKTGYAYIINNAGLMLAYPDKSKILSLDLSQYPFGQQMLDQKKGVIHYRFKGVDKMVAFAQEATMKWIVASTANKDEIFSPVTRIRNLNVLISVACVVIISGVLFFITRSIVNPINTIITGMGEGANQVAAASGQVSSSSQFLAEGASQQASAIEETSSMMIEMSSITKNNADNAGHANTLMTSAMEVITTAHGSMSELTDSMEEISGASKETFKIIKTIDEIAFQTNLLALNAAVEAARAGEAGAGFAVVADEVRNLAMRAATAAKNTSELIEGIVKKIQKGAELVSINSETFSQVTESTDKAGALVSEISDASNEQYNGIEQVNDAISEMDKVVQQNAASAEESASASEEMNAQAEMLNDYVSSLVTLVSGKTVTKANKIGYQPIKPVGNSKRSSGNEKRPTLALDRKEVTPEQVIPFVEAEEFKDFKQD